MNHKAVFHKSVIFLNRALHDCSIRHFEAFVHRPRGGIDFVLVERGTLGVDAVENLRQVFLLAVINNYWDYCRGNLIIQRLPLFKELRDNID